MSKSPRDFWREMAANTETDNPRSVLGRAFAYASENASATGLTDAFEDGSDRWYQQFAWGWESALELAKQELEAADQAHVAAIEENAQREFTQDVPEVDSAHEQALEIEAAKGAQLQIHTAGLLHSASSWSCPAPTFTYNLSDLLDDPAHKPGAELIDLDGTCVEVQDFVFQSEGALALFEDIVDTVARQLIRKPITVLFLCRGGKHRSVAFGEALAFHFDVTATHHHKHLPRVVSAPAARVAGVRR